MKKSLIAVAVAGLFAAPVAMAEVTISGAVNYGIEATRSSANTTNTNPSLSRTQLASNYSHLDLESVDDIGGGNKVIMHYQFDISGPGGNQGGLAGPSHSAISNRNSFLGVAGGWGAFKMGTNENVYERFMYTADPLDGALGPGGNLMILATPGGGAFDIGQTQCGTPGAGGCTGFYRRSEHTIWYESPNLSGFSFEVDYTLSAKKTAAGVDPKILSAGGKFQPEGAPFYVDLSFEKHDDMFGASAAPVPTVGGTGSNDTAMQVGGGWMIGDLGLHLRYEALKYKTEGIAAGLVNEYKRNAYWFGVKYNLPSGYVGAELGIAQEGKTNLGTATDTGAKMFSVGYFHNLSKQSQLQFIYGRTDNDAKGTYGQAAAPNFGAAGSDHQVLHVGIKHTF